jgi:hypothetical protein
MQVDSNGAQFLLSDVSVWHTPHVVQTVRRGELGLTEFLRILVRDLAFGMSQDKWVEELCQEGNIGLASELGSSIGLAAKGMARVQLQQAEWNQMVEVAKADLAQYVQHEDELTEQDRQDHAEALDVADKLVGEGAYGDAVSIMEQALTAMKSAVERRRAAVAAAHANADHTISQAGAVFAAMKAATFPRGLEAYQDARTLLLKAYDQLYQRQYKVAVQLAEWVQAMCEGGDFPADEVKTWSRSASTPLPEQPPEEAELAPDASAVMEPEQFEFELEWAGEDDQYLIDNYDVMSVNQLNLRFHASPREVLCRMRYLGLVHPVEHGKRVRWPNPYVAGKPLRGTRVFVGREDVFSFIEDNLGPSQIDDRNLVALVGHRRTGKTSILLQLRKPRREVLGQRIPIFIDMEGLLPFPGGFRNFFWKLALRVQEEIQDQEQITLPRPTEHQFADEPSLSFQDFLHQAEQAAQGRGLVLMLDEFQAIEPRLAQVDIDVYKMLRSVIQHDPNVDFILCGTMEVEDMMRRQEAVMFGSALTKRIDFLDEKDARRLITSPVQNYVSYSPDAVDLIVKVTASHPYFVQLVCGTLMRHLIERGKSKVSVNDVERILPQVREQGTHIREIWLTDTTELEQYVMATVGELAATRDSWCMVPQIAGRLEQEMQVARSPDDLDEAIQNLTKRGILSFRQDGTAVRFQVDVFRQWVQANKPFGVVRREIRADAARQRRVAERQPKRR